ncbi:MAG: YihY/virulence factor BrkB family protein [Actinomycetota bacterium]|nr:YihY/virulence factor BrkB family protein [Actinomycetota bacterium]
MAESLGRPAPLHPPASREPNRLDRLRARYGWLDHVIRAITLYTERNADVLAGSITYFGFLALFPLLLLAASVFGFVLTDRPELLADVIAQIVEYIPGAAGDQLVEALNAAIESRNAVGIVGLLGLIYAGLGWINKLRLAFQTLWQGKPEAGSFLKDNARDLLTLVGLGGGLVASLVITAVGTAAASYLVGLAGLSEVPGITLITGAAAIVLAIGGSTLVFAWLLGSLSGHDITFRSVLPGAVLAAVGFEILKLVGGFYLSLVSNSVSAGVFGSVVGILLFIYLACRFLLFCVAWTATLPRFARLGLGPAPENSLAQPAAAPSIEPTQRVPDPEPAISPTAVAAGLVATGVVAGAVGPAILRRWWRRDASGRREQSGAVRRSDPEAVGVPEHG